MAQDFTTFEVRYRRPFDTTAAHAAYRAIGSGGGIAWSAGIRAAAVPLQGEIGMQKQTDPVLLSIGLRERFLGLIGSGSPPLDASTRCKECGSGKETDLEHRFATNRLQRGHVARCLLAQEIVHDSHALSVGTASLLVTCVFVTVGSSTAVAQTRGVETGPPPRPIRSRMTSPSLAAVPNRRPVATIARHGHL
jgi:hypothetical protein